MDIYMIYLMRFVAGVVVGIFVFQLLLLFRERRRQRGLKENIDSLWAGAINEIAPLEAEGEKTLFQVWVQKVDPDYVIVDIGILDEKGAWCQYNNIPLTRDASVRFFKGGKGDHLVPPGVWYEETFPSEGG